MIRFVVVFPVIATAYAIVRSCEAFGLAVLKVADVVFEQVMGARHLRRGGDARALGEGRQGRR
jgi:hypothetical protein